MSQPSCAGSVRLCLTQFGKLDADGFPIEGTGNGIRTDQSIRLTFEPNMVTGEDSSLKNGCGDIKVALKDVDVPNRYNLSLQLAYPDPEIWSFLTGGVTYTSGGNVIGAQAPALGVVPDAVANGVGFEFWTKRAGSAGQAQDYKYWRFVFPKTQWWPASRTVEEAPMVTEYNGIAYENVNYGDGAFNDFAHDSTKVLQYVMVTTIPASSCGAIATPASP